MAARADVRRHLLCETGKLYPLLGWSENQNPCYYWNRPALSMPAPDGAGVGTTLMVQSVHDPATNARLAYAPQAK